MDAKVTWKKNMVFETVSDSGKSVMLDANSDPMERQGPGPMELILMGLVGCTAMDVVSIMEKKKQNLSAFEVRVNADRAQDYPKVYTRAELVYEATGHGLDKAALLRAIELSIQKYCPVHAMLSKVFPISQRYVMYEDEGKGARKLVAEGSYVAD